MQPKITICHISQSAGGVETYINEIISNTSKKFNHIVICGNNGTLYKTAHYIGAKVIFIKMVREISLFKDLLTLIRIIAVIIKIKPNILHVHSGKGGFWGRIAGLILGIPTIFTPNAFSHLGLTSGKKKFILTVEKVLSNKGIYFVGASNSECIRAINEIGWKENKVFNIFPNSITVSSNILLKKDNKKIDVILVGRMTYQKNPELFLEIVNKIVAQNNKIRFCWIGSGYGDELGKIIRQKIVDLKLGDKIMIKPWTTKQEVIKVLSESHIYLSTSRYEGLPFVLLEAMDNFMPLVVSNVDGNRDVVSQGVNGYLCNSVDDYIEAILLLSSNESLRTSLGNNSKKLLLEKFNIKKNIKNLESIYECITKVTN